MSRRLTIPVIAATLIAACATGGSDVAVTCADPGVSVAGWQRHDLGSFSIQVPPGFSRVEVQGIDSQVGAFRNADGSAEITFDLGWYSNDLSSDAATFASEQRCTNVIGDRAATVVTGELRQPSQIGGRYVAAAAWRNINQSDPPVHLTVWSTARAADQLPLLNAAIGTVRFE